MTPTKSKIVEGLPLRFWVQMITAATAAEYQARAEQPQQPTWSKPERPQPAQGELWED